MDYAKLNGEYYVRVDPGEEILAAVTEICEREKIFGGHFQGIGACDEITLSSYVPADDEFVVKNFAGMFEIVALIGNVTRVDEKINLHAHATFAYLDENKNFASLGGHLKRARVNYTAEIVIRPASEIISRRFDLVPNVGVWNFGHGKF